MYNLNGLKSEMLERVYQIQKELDWSFNCVPIEDEVLQKMSVSVLALLITNLENVLGRFKAAKNEWISVYDGYTEERKKSLGATERN